MKIADNVEMLEVASPSLHHPVLTWDYGNVVLIDSSFPGQIDALDAELARCGFSINEITHVILTHQDVDHIGNARTLKEKGAQILAGEIDTPFIEGDKPLTKITDLEALSEIPPERRDFYNMLTTTQPKVVTKVDQKLVDGDVLDMCGGIRVVFTPGHTPGHIALLLRKSNVLVCGDAANVTDDELIGSRPVMTHDMAQAEVSLEKIKSQGADAYLCYHTGYVAAKPWSEQP